MRVFVAVRLGTRRRLRGILATFLAVLTISHSATISLAQDESKPWWDDWPLIQIDAPVSTAVAFNATVVYQVDASQSNGIGTYGTKLFSSPGVVAEAHAAGLKSLTYFNAYGEAQSFIAELMSGGGEVTPIGAFAWGWSKYGGGPIVWVGAHNFFSDDEFARPYTYTHPVYGGVPMEYPDGTIASGYTDPANPLTSRVYDAGCSKDILGNLAYYYEPIEEGVQVHGPHNGLLLINGQYVGVVNPSRDSACPMWVSLNNASIKIAADAGVDGIWVDNFSAWGSFSAWPNQRAFGDWSVALFRDYLFDNFSGAELASMGVGDPDVFDVRAALRSQVIQWGGNDTDLFDPVWNDARWRDNSIWRAYVIYKRQKGTEALNNYYDGAKQAAAEHGKPEFLVEGNDVPTFSLGWVRDSLDMTGSEATGEYLDTGTKGFMLPPIGRWSPRYKLGSEHTRGRFNTYWLQFRSAQEQPYLGQRGLSLVLFYEMLAAHALPSPNILVDPRDPGTASSYTDFFAFVNSAKLVFEDRVPVVDVGIYYSSSSLLIEIAPGGYDWDNQPHQFGGYGWATALGELHGQYRFVPEWKLNTATLSELRVLIVPNAEVFDPTEVSIVESWVQDGGRLIVTGNSGLRLGESGNFERNSGGLSLVPLTGVASMSPPPPETMNTVGMGKVLFIPDNIGMEYFKADVQRSTLLSKFSTALGQVLNGAGPPLIDAPTVPTTVGLTLYRDEGNLRQFVDINNFNIDLASDKVLPAGPISFEVALPPWMNISLLRIYGVSPDGPASISFEKAGTDRLSITLDQLTYYTSVVMEALPSPTAPLLDPGGIAKSRFLSLSVPASATAATFETALRVNLESLHHVDPPYTGGASVPFTGFEGQVRWVGPPTQYIESASSGTPFYASQLQCDPYYQDWSTVGLLHVTGSAIVPSSTYEVENLAGSCMGSEANCTAISTPLTIATTRWGDVVDPFNPPSTTTQPDFGDIGALVNKFKSAVGAPIKARALLAGTDADGNVDPTPDLGFTHISACVDAFKGLPYPYTIAECP